ncbi:MAG: HAMP domain-containing sensor histidine kinase [Candidatus Cloacimonetes bacterium]|jgi:signal transduction histidine kinase|nr:HAMP domain-containing sensor histidine kinase [Candidatus Cloacimonadota bacterium]MDD4806533.1 HAMP domain-containing sensor histidine kinase [Candidatus Cloacimonadota bacterium]
MKPGELRITAPDAATLQDEIIQALNKAGFQAGKDYNIHLINRDDGEPDMKEETRHYYLDEMAKLNNDLTNMQRQLAKANAELAKLVEIRNRFVGMAAHDLRNPLGVIKNFADFLILDMKDCASEDQMDIMNTIRSTAIFMQRLIEGILDLSSMQSGKVTLKKTESELNEVFQGIVKLNRTLAATHGITIDYQGISEKRVIAVDLVKIRQVVNNLLSNAIKFSPDDSTITCSLELRDGFCLFCVKDEGIGVSEEHQKVIFEPFRSVSEHSRREKSVGLGLSIAKNIVEAHGGKLTVQSEEGKGAVFCLSLPL